MALDRALLGLALLAVGGCAEDPPPAESDIRTVIMQASTEAAPVICEPGSTRECKIFWTSESEPGVQHCMLTEQVCGATGQTWLPCGHRSN